MMGQITLNLKKIIFYLLMINDYSIAKDRLMDELGPILSLKKTV